MRIVVQRVSRAEVRVDGRSVGAIGTGLVLLVAVEAGDGPEEVRQAAHRLATLRVFDDGEGRMNRGLDEVGGAVLVVSQFTLAGSIRRGRALYGRGLYHKLFSDKPGERGQRGDCPEDVMLHA